MVVTPVIVAVVYVVPGKPPKLTVVEPRTEPPRASRVDVGRQYIALGDFLKLPVDAD
jgi:hypothetical protein